MAWDRENLWNLPIKGTFIPKNDDRIETYREDTMYRGTPDGVLIARDDQEIGEVVQFCNGHGIPVTFCGSQTSMTGASVADEGLIISTERLEGVTDIFERDGEWFATAKPGTIVADLQKAVAEVGHFYPVAPTSRDECRIGSNVATNATGEDSFKYGPIRHYIRGLELILPDGSRKTLERGRGERPSWERNRAGYFVDWKNPIDLIIGSEGTLAYVSSVTLSLVPELPTFFAGLIPFPSNKKVLDCVIEIAMKDHSLKPRTLELVDSGALEMMKTAEGFPKISNEARAFLYIKQEYADESERDSMLALWYEKAMPFTGQALADQILIALTPKDQENFRLWRHRIPEVANEYGRKYWEQGGGKIGSDWWVPLPRLHEMMEHFYFVADATGLSYMGYAHIGSGHPHTNFMAANPDEMRRAHDALISCCRKAVELRGGVAGEHGIGKIHTDLVPIQHVPGIIEKMKSWKKEYDPKWILGRGNIFRAQ